MLDATKNFPSLPRSWFSLFTSRRRPASRPSFPGSSYTWEKSENSKASRKVMCFTQRAKVSSKSTYFTPTVHKGQPLAAPNSSTRDVKGRDVTHALCVTRKRDLSVLFSSAAIFPLIAYTSHRSLESHQGYDIYFITTNFCWPFPIVLCHVPESAKRTFPFRSFGLNGM